MTERAQIAERWRQALDWRAPDDLARRAAAAGRRHYRGGWPGFPELPFALSPPPDEADLSHLRGGYAEYDALNAEHFDGLCPPVKLVLNPRLRSTAGRIDCLRRILELNAGRLQELPETRIETIFHEMIHLWLYAQGLPCGHSPLFRAKMAERGHVSTGYGRADDPKGPRHRYVGDDRRVVYRCPKCGQEYRRRRRYSEAMACRRCYDTGAGRQRLYEVGEGIEPEGVA